MENLSKDVVETTEEILADMSGVGLVIPEGGDIVTAIANFFSDNADNPEMLTNVINDAVVLAEERTSKDPVSFVPNTQAIGMLKTMEPIVMFSMVSEQQALLGDVPKDSFIANIGNADLAAVPENAVTSGSLDSFYKANTLKAEQGVGVPDPGYNPTVDYSTTVLTTDGIIKDTANTSTDFNNLHWKPEMRVDPMDNSNIESIRGCTSSIQHLDDLGLSNVPVVTGTAVVASELSTVNLVQDTRIAIAEDVGAEFMSEFTTPESAVPSNVYSAKDFTIDVGAANTCFSLPDGSSIPVVNVLTDVEAAPILEEQLKTISEDQLVALGRQTGKTKLTHLMVTGQDLDEAEEVSDISDNDDNRGVSLIPEQQVTFTPVDPTKPIESDVDVFSIPDVLESENEIDSSKVSNVKMSANAGPINPLKNPNAQLAAFAAIAAGLSSGNGLNDLNIPFYPSVPDIRYPKRSGSPNSSNVVKTRAKNKAAAKARKRNRK